MTDPDSTSRDLVDPLIAAALATADRDLAGSVRPAFSGVVARAHRIDPEAVPARWLRSSGDRWPAPTTSHDTRRRWTIAACSLAAAALLAFAVQRTLVPRDDREAHAFQAGSQPEPTRPAPAISLAPHEPSPVLEIPPPPAPPSERPRERLDDLLARLDDEAEACMQAGELACAEARYKEIVQRGGRRVQVELAFADRFHLARQRRDDADLRALWTAYLARFPRGQFADDARGGLCRLADETTRDACWQTYLAEFPTGSFAAEAQPR